MNDRVFSIVLYMADILRNDRIGKLTGVEVTSPGWWSGTGRGRNLIEPYVFRQFEKAQRP